MPLFRISAPGKELLAHMSIYQVITDHIIATIEKGNLAPWRQPWVASSVNIPRNAKTDQPYNGINVFTLTACGFEDPRWLTFCQAKRLDKLLVQAAGAARCAADVILGQPKQANARITDLE
jgi:antirestriction protein ArdC